MDVCIKTDNLGLYCHFNDEANGPAHDDSRDVQ